MTISEIKRFVESGEPVWFNLDGKPRPVTVRSAEFFQPEKQNIFVLDTVEVPCSRVVPISMLYPSRLACLDAEIGREWMCGDSVWTNDNKEAVKGVITQIALSDAVFDKGTGRCIYTIWINGSDRNIRYKDWLFHTELDCWYAIRAQEIANSTQIVLAYQKYQLTLDDIERKIASLQRK